MSHRRTVTISTQRALMLALFGQRRHCRTSRDMTGFRSSFRIAALAAFAMLLLAAPRRRRTSAVPAIFSTICSAVASRPRIAPACPVQPAPSGRVAQSDPGDLSVRLDRMESALRQLTGTIEQLQYRNQQLEMQLKRMQDDTEYRLQQLGSRGGAAPPPQAAPLGAGERAAACVESRKTL